MFKKKEFEKMQNFPNKYEIFELLKLMNFSLLLT